MSSDGPTEGGGSTQASTEGGAIAGVICDFGGVLTTPLLDAFLAFEGRSGIPLEAHGQALMAITARTGTNPLFELEVGRVSEAEFLAEMEAEISEHLGRPVEMAGFGEAFMAELRPNARMIDYMGQLRGRGLRMAICTNNVREWEAAWRAKLPVDEIFETVVDSAFVGIRKPDEAIYRITLERIGLPAERVIFVDDTDINCEAARRLGMTAVQFGDTDQAIAEIEAALTGSGVGASSASVSTSGVGGPTGDEGTGQFSEPSRSQQ